MKQFILPAPPGRDGRIRLSGKDFHYLARVRRVSAGDSFDALLPDGRTVRLTVESLSKASLTGICIPADRTGGTKTSLPPILLFQALPKGSKMDLIVRQAAEGGITEVIPFYSEYALPKPRPEKGEAGKLERWRRIVKEALQQSGSRTATSVREPASLEDALAYWKRLIPQYDAPAGILLHQAPLENGSLHGYLSTNPQLVALAVGPEGGFSPGEVSLFLSAGFNAVLIGDTVLRTETAALYAGAAIRIILLERPWWTPKHPEQQQNVSHY
ncbi:16S rRNA (uracil(1498)-N(3))-methyltransferase [Treponema sp. OttesenSCG-928-L16]|nr:16S rRNA (uracil(1498)-N(3))-methyltransferase [Treponema sp. OttesenSCG-928-L16]